MSAHHRQAAIAGIGKRMRRRRLRESRTRRALERESESTRDARLRLLAELCGKLECGHFDAEELRQARAELIDRVPGSPQGSLTLRGKAHA